VIVRTGVAHERAALEDLQRRSLLRWDDYRPYLLANPDIVELPLSQLQTGRVRVAEHDSQLAGFAVLLLKGGCCELDGLFVEPDLWGMGIGRALVTDALARARTAGAEAIEANANPRVESFYQRLGFAVTGKSETPFGPAHRMRLAVFSR
jgi:GNAT superfamily N-acetyltransferase